jgi:hypothetical protein
MSEEPRAGERRVQMTRALIEPWSGGDRVTRVRIYADGDEALTDAWLEQG